MAVPDGLLSTEDGITSLVVGYSPTSGRHHFPVAPVCPYAGTDDVTETHLSGKGRLFAWTAVTSAPPGYDGPVPYGLGVVQFDRFGLRVVGRLTEPDPQRLASGQTMELVTEDVPGAGPVWAFAPAPGEPDAPDPVASGP